VQAEDRIAVVIDLPSRSETTRIDRHVLRFTRRN
jgi:hypothetical protein